MEKKQEKTKKISHRNDGEQRKTDKLNNSITEINGIILPIYKIKNKFYFLDKRLNEYRNIKNPFDVLNFNSVSLNDLQKPTAQDKINLGRLLGLFLP